MRWLRPIQAVPLALLLSACARAPAPTNQAPAREGATSASPEADRAVVVPAPSLPTSDVLPILDPGKRDAPALLSLRSATILRGARSVGSTSLVLRLRLEGGLEAAFKLETKKHGGLYRSEVAAYRLALALGLDNVPPSVPRTVKLATLFDAAPELRSRLETEPVRRGDTVAGAMIAWLPGLRVLPLEREPLFSAWGGWLSQRGQQAGSKQPRVAASVTATEPLAPQIAALVAFDHVTGNVDRWSGHNVFVDSTGTRVVFLDNNLAFIAKLGERHVRKRKEILARVERFPRGLVTRLRAVSRADLVSIFGKDHEGKALLSDEQIDACLLRRDELVGHVDDLGKRHGTDKVLAFE